MAGGSAGERLIGWYGGVAEKNLSTRPDFVRNWLMLGFQAMRGKVHLVPYGDLLPSGNHGYQLFMDSVVARSQTSTMRWSRVSSPPTRSSTPWTLTP